MIPLAAKGNPPSPAKNDAQNAIVFFYRQISRDGSGRRRGIGRAKEPANRSVVVTRDEERAVLARLDGVRCGMASRLYSSGLQLMEYAGCASGTSIRIKTRSSNSGFDFELPSC